MKSEIFDRKINASIRDASHVVSDVLKEIGFRVYSQLHMKDKDQKYIVIRACYRSKDMLSDHINPFVHSRFRCSATLFELSDNKTHIQISKSRINWEILEPGEIDEAEKALGKVADQLESYYPHLLSA